MHIQVSHKGYGNQEGEGCGSSEQQPEVGSLLGGQSDKKGQETSWECQDSKNKEHSLYIRTLGKRSGASLGQGKTKSSSECHAPEAGKPSVCDGKVQG